VEFDPGHVPGLITLAGMEMELSEKLGRKVDLRTAEDLSRHFRAEVVSSAIPQYERA
jgi:predicted nucleotidyltransferase